MAVKKKQKTYSRFKNIKPDHPLTPKEQIFVSEYVRTKHIAKAAIAAGFAAKTAASHGWILVNVKPNTKAAIAEQLSRFFDRLAHDTYDVLKKLTNIGMTRASEISNIKDGKVVVTETAKLSEQALDLFAGAVERVAPNGDRYVEAKTHDQLAAIKLLCQYHGILDKTRRAKLEPIREQKEALEAVLKGDKTALEAALELELAGVPLPETLAIMLRKADVEDGDADDDASCLPTHEEMEARRKERLKEIEKQKEEFLPKRREEVRAAKEEIGKTNKSFSKEPDVQEG